MKFKNIFSFSSQNKAPYKSCDNFDIIIDNKQQVASRDIHSEYTVKEMLGKGGFGRVFTAVRKSDGVEVAVKEVVKDSRYKSDNQNNNFPSEIALMQQVKNISGVVEILDYFDTEECYYIIMEKFNSKDLFDFITEHGPLSESIAQQMFREIVETVIKCRQNGVLHRDIKDENILVDMNTLKTKLIDFGSGCFFNNSTQKHKIFGEFRGTRVYSPPEWVQFGEYTGDGLTVWSLGILLYDMLCGDIPYTTDAEICSGKLFWHKHVKLSKEAKDLVEKCLTILPDKRINLDSLLLHPWLEDKSELKTSTSTSSLMSTSPLSTISSSSSSFEPSSHVSNSLLIPPSSSSLIASKV